jgi:hypothetical protein
MAVSLGSGWHASSAPGTAHHCYYLHHSTKPDKIALHCYMVTILILNEKKNAISSANLDDTIDFCIFLREKEAWETSSEVFRTTIRLAVLLH